VSDKTNTQQKLGQCKNVERAHRLRQPATWDLTACGFAAAHGGKASGGANPLSAAALNMQIIFIAYSFIIFRSGPEARNEMAARKEVQERRHHGLDLFQPALPRCFLDKRPTPIHSSRMAA
jgi:hypothetical protein